MSTSPASQPETVVAEPTVINPEPGFQDSSEANLRVHHHPPPFPSSGSSPAIIDSDIPPCSEKPADVVIDSTENPDLSAPSQAVAQPNPPVFQSWTPPHYPNPDASPETPENLIGTNTETPYPRSRKITSPVQDKKYVFDSTRSVTSHSRVAPSHWVPYFDAAQEFEILPEERSAAYAYSGHPALNVPGAFLPVSSIPSRQDDESWMNWVRQSTEIQLLHMTAPQSNSASSSPHHSPLMNHPISNSRSRSRLDLPETSSSISTASGQNALNVFEVSSTNATHGSHRYVGNWTKHSTLHQPHAPEGIVLDQSPQSEDTPSSVSSDFREENQSPQAAKKQLALSNESHPKEHLEPASVSLPAPARPASVNQDSTSKSSGQDVPQFTGEKPSSKPGLTPRTNTSGISNISNNGDHLRTHHSPYIPTNQRPISPEHQALPNPPFPPTTNDPFFHALRSWYKAGFYAGYLTAKYQLAPPNSVTSTPRYYQSDAPSATPETALDYPNNSAKPDPIASTPVFMSTNRVKRPLHNPMPPKIVKTPPEDAPPQNADKTE